jgi:hypothetical protein
MTMTPQIPPSTADDRAVELLTSRPRRLTAAVRYAGAVAAATVVAVGMAGAAAAAAPRPVAATGQVCTIVGTNGNDRLVGTRGHDVICGMGGNDTVDGGLGNDIVDGGRGNDTVEGGEGNDSLVGGPGSDVLRGGRGNDQVHGGDGVDAVHGDEGNDTLLPTVDTSFGEYLGAPSADNSADRTITLRIRAGDDLSGVANVWADYRTNGAQSRLDPRKVAGEDGIWELVGTLPRTTTPGVWRVTGLYVTDRVGRQRVYYVQPDGSYTTSDGALSGVAAFPTFTLLSTAGKGQ